MKDLLCELLFGCLLATPGAKGIDELTYGTALFAYYQQDYEQALVDVMVAERQQRLGDEPLRFQLAKGSFAFERGMYRLATETFAGVPPGELSELDHMRLAFHLAREYYRRGEWSAMDEQLAAVDLGRNWRGRERRHPEATFMRAEGALARSDFAAARQVLETLPEDSAFLPYGLFNLGVAERQAGDPVASRAAFAQLAAIRPHDPESWDLVQRGRLALSVMARQTGDPLDAEALLGALPGEGRYRDQALASYGKLAMAAGDDALAARIWQTLLTGDGWSSSRAVAELGLPMSLERLGAPAHALDRYRDAEQAFSGRLVALQVAAQQARDPAWVDALLDVFAEPDEALRAQRLGRFDDGLGEETWLEWLAGEDVHQVMVEWRELNAMAAWLERLPARLDAFEEVTRERGRRTEMAGEMLGAQELLARRTELAERVTATAADIERLTREPARMQGAWMLRLANPEERTLISRLDAMAHSAERLPARQREGVEARVRRLTGLVFWDIADDRSARVRVLDRELEANRELLADVDERIERLGAARERFAVGVETDFVALDERARDVSLRVSGALQARRRVIADALERGLEQELAQTRQYLLTARIAVARATDQLAVAGDADGSDS